MELLHRPRRLRTNSSIRKMVQETHIKASQLILPIFICEGKNIEKSHPQLPSLLTLSPDRAVEKLKRAQDLGIQCSVLFGVSAKRDAKASEAFNEKSALVQGIRQIRKELPKLLVATDIALDPFTDHGHDGLIADGKVLNDETVEALCKMSLIHANAGAQMVAPSDMMDGRVGAIRTALDENDFQDVSILAYTAKYSSCFYGPFRDTLGSTPQNDKTSYQLNPANRREAWKELELDIAEGADMVMVKPAWSYLDIISDFKTHSSVPVAAYQVSGECAMIEVGAREKLFDRDQAIWESTHSIFRAGADLVLSYFALELAEKIKES